MTFSVQTALDNYLAQGDAWDTTKSFYISDMGKCLRMRILKRQGKTPAPIDPRSRRILAIGKVNHLYLQDILIKNGSLVEKEIFVEWKEYELRGRADVLVQTDEGLILYDFKNTHSRKILYSKKEDTHYIMQVLTYLYLLKPEYSDLQEARIALISRNDWIIMEKGYHLTTVWQKRIEREVKSLWDYWQKKELPPELEKNDPMAWLCGYCSYIEYCPNIKKGGKDGSSKAL